MKFFSKKNKDDLYLELEEKDLLENSEIKIKMQHKPDALTAEEVLGGIKKNPVKASSTNALDELKKRLNSIAEQNNNKSETEAQNTEIKEYAQPKEEKTTVFEDIKSETVVDTVTLFDKCKPFMSDEDGREVELDNAPLYKLQSVADILKSDSEKTLERLSAKYDFSFDDLGNSSKEKNETPVTAEMPEEKIAPPMAEDIPEPQKENIKADVFEDAIPIKNMQSNVSFVISDIDVPDSINSDYSKPVAESNNSTITFTPVSNAKGLGSGITVSSQTRPIDLTGELAKLPDSTNENDEEIRLEKNEFEDYIPDTEFSSTKEAGKLVRLFSIKKRSAFLATVFSFFITIIFAGIKLPFMSEILLSHTRVTLIVCTALTVIITLLNIDMFKALKNLFKRNSTADICMSFATIVTLAYAVCGILTENITTDILELLNICLSFRALSHFYKNAYILSNLKQIANSNKNALRLINDPAITFSMAKNAVEGDVLIAAAQKTDFIADYIKHSEYGVFLGGKLPVINVSSLLISIILGVVCGIYFDGLFYGLYAAAVVQCLTALPIVFLIENLPNYRAAKKLNPIGAMIAGKTGAEFVEMANAIVLNSSDLFPAGTVTLHQMQVLSENNLDDTIIRAASLTECLNSPLAPIFKKITGNSDISALPDSDTVKYEDRMGISGWVDNRLLFIGNRTLMEAHGIDVPSIEIDRKILRQGYFPIYVATRDKACALLVVQYKADPEISRELRRLSRLGVTMLINSNDPNLTEEMICDYLGLYNDSVKVMSAAGCHMYKNAVVPVKSVSAPAAFRTSPTALPKIINCASGIKRSNRLLSIIYIIALVLATVIFAYSSLGGSGELVSDTYVMLYGIFSTVISYLIYLTARP